MGNYELIEELCSVARLQADIIYKSKPRLSLKQKLPKA